MSRVINIKKDEARDQDLINAEVALKRAAKRAREVAEQTHTPIVVYRNGRIIEEQVAKSKG